MWIFWMRQNMFLAFLITNTIWQYSVYNWYLLLLLINQFSLILVSFTFNFHIFYFYQSDKFVIFIFIHREAFIIKVYWNQHQDMINNLFFVMNNVICYKKKMIRQFHEVVIDCICEKLFEHVAWKSLVEIEVIYGFLIVILMIIIMVLLVMKMAHVVICIFYIFIYN
jgi:hypothetical protein